MEQRCSHAGGGLDERFESSQRQRVGRGIFARHPVHFASDAKREAAALRLGAGRVVLRLGPHEAAAKVAEFMAEIGDFPL